MKQLIEHISFQRRVCENQLNAYKSIMNESHPKYKVLKEEYNFYLLMEDIAKSLKDKNVIADQIDDATATLNKAINDFKTSLSTLNEAGFFDKTKKVFRGLTTGYDINDLEKEKSIENFTKVYQIFKPLVLAANVISSMFDKQGSEGYIINAEKLKPLKLFGSIGNELKPLILKATSSSQGLKKLQSSLPLLQNYGAGATNPILTTFISQDLVSNPINVGISVGYGGTAAGTYLRSKSSHEVPGEVNPANIKDDTQGFNKDLTPNATGGTSQSPNVFGAHATNGPHNNLNTGLGQNASQQNGSSSDNKNTRTHDDLRKVANGLGISKQEQDKMQKNGIFNYIKSNPDLLSQLINTYKNPSSSVGPAALKESGKAYLTRLVKEHKQEGTLMIEVVNKWNKLAGLKG